MAVLSFERGLDVLQARRTALTWTLYLYMGLSATMAPVTLADLAGELDYDAVELDVPSVLGVLVSLAYIAILLISIIMVCMWIYRAHANLRAAGVTGLETSPGWAIGWFFIPILNLFKPFEAMRELWHASHAQTDEAPDKTPRDLIVWWSCYLVGSVLKNVGSRIAAVHEVGFLIDMVSSLILAVSAWFLLAIVRKVTQAQVDFLGANQTFA